MLFTFDPEVMQITLLSLQVSGSATLISLLIGFIGILVLKKSSRRHAKSLRICLNTC
jgi:ABC-type tungstate transport system substrate-binding protein